MANISNTVSIFGDLLACLLPRQCAACDTNLIDVEKVFCIECVRIFRLPAYATKNSWHELFTYPLKGVVVANKFHPGGRVQRAVHALKYSNRADAAAIMGAIISEHLPSGISGTLLPVPQTKRGLRKRGYNQAHLLANAISASRGLRVTPRLLSRNGEYSTQTNKSRLDRISWIHNQLRAYRGEYNGGTVWLVDDVLTTGATLNACMEKLWVEGIRDLGVIVWASA